MNLSKKFAILALSGLLMAGFTACSSDDPSDNGDNGELVPPAPEPGEPDPSIKGVMSTAEAGQYIETTAKELEKICNPQDQAGAVSALNAIANVLDSYDFADDASFGRSVASAARAMARGAENGDYPSLARATQQISQDMTVNPYGLLGIYTPVYNRDYEEYVWTLTSKSSDAIIFRSEKDRTEVSIKVSKESWTGKFDTEDWDYDYDYETGNYVDYEITNHWTVTVPAEMRLDMSYSGQTALSGVVKSNFNEAAHNFTVNTTAEMANIKAYAAVAGNDSKIVEQVEATIGDTRVVYSTGEVTGSNLCNRQVLEQLGQASINEISAQIDNLFKNANVKIDLLDRIQLETKCSTLRDIIRTADYDDESLKEVNSFVAAFNTNVKSTLYFGNTSYNQGSISLGTVERNSWGYRWYDITPMIQLASGGSPMAFDDFFESGALDGAATTIQNIINTYRRAFSNY